MGGAPNCAWSECSLVRECLWNACSGFSPILCTKWDWKVPSQIDSSILLGVDRGSSFEIIQWHETMPDAFEGLCYIFPENPIAPADCTFQGHLPPDQQLHVPCRFGASKTTQLTLKPKADLGSFSSLVLLGNHHLCSTDSNQSSRASKFSLGSTANHWTLSSHSKFSCFLKSPFGQSYW